MNVDVFRSCVIEALPKSGRKIWRSLYLDLQFIQLGIKKTLLFDYANVSFDSLVSLVHTIKARCIGEIIWDELMVMKAGEDSFIFHYSKFLEYLAEVELMYFDSSQSNNKRRMIVDISTSSSSPKELDNKREIEELRKVIKEVIGKLVALRMTDSCCYVELSVSDEISWSTIYGIFLNYPVVYWLNTENSNLLGENLINYQIRMKENLLFETEVPKNYSALSFSVPDALISLCGEVIVLQWFSSLNGSISDRICPSIYLQRTKANGFQTSL